MQSDNNIWKTVLNVFPLLKGVTAVSLRCIDAHPCALLKITLFSYVLCVTILRLCFQAWNTEGRFIVKVLVWRWRKFVAYATSNLPISVKKLEEHWLVSAGIISNWLWDKTQGEHWDRQHNNRRQCMAWQGLWEKRDRSDCGGGVGTYLYVSRKVHEWMYLAYWLPHKRSDVMFKTPFMNYEFLFFR